MFTSKRPKSSLNLGGILCLTAGIYFTYYLLVQDILPFSISSVLSHTCYGAKKWNLITIGLIPIYLGLVIFGTSVLSLQGGAALQRWFIKHGKK
jgi:hypothetical protein